MRNCIRVETLGRLSVAEYLIILCEDVSVLPCLPKVPSERFNKELTGQN